MKPEEGHRHRWLSGNRGPAHRRPSTASSMKENGRDKVIPNKKETRTMSNCSNSSKDSQKKSQPRKSKAGSSAHAPYSNLKFLL